MIGYAVAVWAVAIIGGYLPYIGESKRWWDEGGKEGGRDDYCCNVSDDFACVSKGVSLVCSCGMGTQQGHVFRKL